MAEEHDFIATELLKELKEENCRKDAQIKSLHKVIWRLAIGALLAVLLIVGGFLLYLNQYDFSSTSSLQIEKTAEGVYAVIDSDGNVIGQDLTPEELEEFLINGESNSESDEN